MAQLLSAVNPGTLVKLNENGSPVQFYVAAQNYESSLNGSGRTLLVRKDTYDDRVWDSDVNAYASSDLDSWFNSTYKNMLDADIRSLIGTTKIRYTPGNGNTTVGTLSRAVFALSATELGQSHTYANTEGSALPIASTLEIAYRNGSATTQWTRSPYTSNAYNAWRMSSYGNISNDSCGDSNGSRPAFTLPGTLYVLDDGAVSQWPLVTGLTYPEVVMQGQAVPISWSPASGADSYILQRNADNGGWTQVYAGSDTSYSDTAGSWSTVQYQVCGVFSGTNGAFAQTDAISVIAASALVISGSDGDLGTITNDVSYNVATDTGNQISLTRTVNGIQVASLTVDSGFSYAIPVMELPTGFGTIVITASVQATSGTVTQTRTWTYSKTPVSFPSSAAVSVLGQGAQNVLPATLAEAVRVSPAFGGSLDKALDMLGDAVTYTSTSQPKYSQVTVNLSTAQAGDIVNLPENGVMVPFYVASLNYEPTLNTNGTRVLLVRKDVYRNGQWNSSNVNAYAGSTIDTWFNSTYLPMLDSTVRAQVGTTTFYYTPGNGNNTVGTLSRAVFALSAAELGQSASWFNVEGSALPIASTLQVAYQGGSATDQWTRSPYTSYGNLAVYLHSSGNVSNNYCNNSHGSRPAFTLPGTFSATYYVDSSGGVHTEQEYSTAGDFYDLWGNIIPSTKIVTGSYVGTGTYGQSNPNTLTFEFDPKIVILAQSNGITVSLPILFDESTTYFYGYHNSMERIDVTISKSESQSSMSWYSTEGLDIYQFNTQGETYNYIAIL